LTYNRCLSQSQQNFNPRRPITGISERGHRYAAERDFVYNHRERLGFDDLARADVALVGVKGKRLTYATPRGRGKGEPPF
jgi:hypothetical protein